MASPSTPLYTLVVKDNVTIRDDILRTIANGLISLGITNANTGPGSDYFIIATAFANEVCVPGANSVVTADQLCPDTASGPYLDRWLTTFGLSRNPATQSFGNVTLAISTTSTLVVANSELTDSNGLRYEVTTGGTYLNGAQVPVISVDTGSATNHANGDILTWVTPPAYSAPTVSVGLPNGTDGIEGGNDSEADDDEPPRARLMARLQNPPKGGNSADISGWASASTPDVQACFVYPALLGPSTTFFAVCAAPQQSGTMSSTSKNRDLPSALITGTILPYVQGNLPEHCLCVGASIVNQPVDLAILLSLPAAPTASPPGPGGGWLDGTPWPPSVGGAAPVVLTSYVNSTQFTVNATTAPTAGVSHISWVSPLNWQLYSATVLSVTGTSGAYAIVIDTPMPGITTGNAIFPQAVQQANYLTAILAAFAVMGPGEWLSSSSSLFKRAFRHPLPGLTYPSGLTATMLKQVINAGVEVLDANWIYRSATAPTVPSSVTVDPTTQLLTSTAPSLLVPRNLSWYAA
jgi:hypothetical protein